MEKWFEKLNYIHENPVRRGLMKSAPDWVGSSARHYATGEVGTVEIESEMTAARRDRAMVETHVSEARRGAPALRGGGFRDGACATRL